MLHITITS